VEVEVVVEIPQGSRNKYGMNHATGRIRLDRMLFTSTRYPLDYGFIPETLAEDGNPPDAMGEFHPELAGQGGGLGVIGVGWAGCWQLKIVCRWGACGCERLVGVGVDIAARGGHCGTGQKGVW
jgi:hypothetical protein